MEYSEEDFLRLSGIQHFAFCPRQWALIHVEEQWRENYFTITGEQLHDKAHDGGDERRGDLIITRGMPIMSRVLGISGQCDVVEFRKDSAGVALHGEKGLYQPTPVEYKRGKPKQHNADELQLCAEAMCLEEMLVCTIPKGFLYYGEPKRRTEVELTDALRDEVKNLFAQMHAYMSRGYTPKPGKNRKKSACSDCSIKDVCLPGLYKTPIVRDYLANALQEGGG